MTHSLAIEINTNTNNNKNGISVSVDETGVHQSVFIHSNGKSAENIAIWFGLLEDGLIVDHDEEFKQLHNKLMLIAEGVSK